MESSEILSLKKTSFKSYIPKIAFKIEVFEAKDELVISNLIRRNLNRYNNHNSALIGSLRRLRNLYKTYRKEGSNLIVAKLENSRQSTPVACVGLGPLHGLPMSEGVGEIRDLVVESRYRGKGIGKTLLDQGIKEAKKFGYQRLYLETTQKMLAAKTIFLRKGFRPITDKPSLAKENLSIINEQELPCYYLLEQL